MKKNIILLSLITLMFSCVDKEKTLDNGVEIKYLKNGSASQIQEGEIVLLNLQYSLLLCLKKIHQNYRISTKKVKE